MREIIDYVPTKPVQCSHCGSKDFTMVSQVDNQIEVDPYRNYACNNPQCMKAFTVKVVPRDHLHFWRNMDGLEQE
jgi:hypothetical protein